MMHRQEINTIIAQVTPWPMEERMALAQQILREIRSVPRQPAPRQTLTRAVGIAKGSSAPPDDALVKQWLQELRLAKHA